MTVFIPFGKDCSPAFILRYAELRKESLPFDWNLAYAQHIKRSFDVKFEDWFTDIELIYHDGLVPDAVQERTTNKCSTINHNYPISQIDHPGLGFIAHFDLTDPTVVETIKKRIKRFYEIISSDEDIVFFSSSSYEDLDKHGLLNYFNRDAKTSFLFLDYKISNKKNISIDEVNGYKIIRANATHSFDHDMFHAIANTVKSLYI